MTEELQRIRIAEALGGTGIVVGESHITWAPPNTPPPYDESGFVVPNYTHSVDACTTLIDFLEKRGYACVMVAQQGKRCCTFTTTGRPDFKTISDTFPKAICKSFLTVLGLWEH